MTLQFTLDGQQVSVEDTDSSLLEVLRDRLGARSPKDGCSPQGQCGCCTVLVDGAPRVACVTPARRVAGRAITTVDGLADQERDAWADAFCATGASQCGFCTPGIIMRLAGLKAKGSTDVDGALLAHLCRCTGWRTIGEAFDAFGVESGPRDLDAASLRATIEGGVAQRVAPDVALGGGGFADDTAPLDALVAVPDGRGGWAVGATLTEARRVAGKVQGRRTTAALRQPLDVPDGDWDVTLRTTWVEPAYLELDASWCEPGGEPVTPLANGGAFGGKTASVAPAAARRLADEHGRAVRVVLSREDTVRLGAKRPPVAAGARADGTGAMRVARTPGVAGTVRSFAPGLDVEEVEVPGPPTSTALRAAGWAEAHVLLSGAAGRAGPVRSPAGAVAEAEVSADGVRVRIACGDPLDDVVLRSYCIGATHMALGWVRSEGIAVDEDGEPRDLTIRSFGILRARDMPPVEVEIDRGGGEPVNGSDAVFAAVAAAAWIGEGCTQDWPTRRGGK
ncbi:MAG TPA: 2Fe-2S iron-sulfur cluster-binding protein [Acidimicrobiales bacterium]|jgi:aerobic-type carbon monoxide dehydrogenase small subunit (CoxS/CutS family)|nr:2Fe-2S iron-sulfur cluster-binding protein [Acidimicrobiales bacterium]